MISPKCCLRYSYSTTYYSVCNSHYKYWSPLNNNHRPTKVFKKRFYASKPDPTPPSIGRLLLVIAKEAIKNFFDFSNNRAVRTITSRLPWEQNLQRLHYYAKQTPFHQIDTDVFSPIYDIAVSLVQERISQNISNSPSTALVPNRSLSPIDTVVVEGANPEFQYDSVETVLSWADIPYILLDPKKASDFSFSPHQTVIVNCLETDFGSDFIKKMRYFVNDGGQLVTFDYALSSLLEKVFPEIIQSKGSHLERSVHIEDYVLVKIPPGVTDNRIIDTFADEPPNLTYCISLRSDIVEIKDKRVNKLLVSEKLKFTNAQDGVLFHFNYGNGEVFHSIPHIFVSQSTAMGFTPTTDFKQIRDYIEAKKGGDEVIELAENNFKEFPNFISLSLIRSATTSLEFLIRIILRQKEKTIILLPDHWE